MPRAPTKTKHAEAAKLYYTITYTYTYARTQTNSWRGSAKVVVKADAEVVVVEELLRKPLRGVAASGPGAFIAGKAVLEREGIRPLPRPQIITGINTGDTHRRRSQAVLHQTCTPSCHNRRAGGLRFAGAWWRLGLVVAKAIQSKLVAQRVGDIELLTQLLPEILFRMPREKERRKPQTKERQDSRAERKSSRGQRIHRAEPGVQILPFRGCARDAAWLLKRWSARRWRTEAQLGRKRGALRRPGDDV